MSCREMRDLIPAYAGGELEENEKIALESHLDACAECAAEASGYRECRALLCGLREVDPPCGTYAAIWNSVQDAFFPVRIHRMSLLLAHAALLLIAFSAGFLATFLGSDGPAEAPPVLVEEPAGDAGVSRDAGVRVPGRYANERPDLPAKDAWHLRPETQSGRAPGRYYQPRVHSIVTDGEAGF